MMGGTTVWMKGSADSCWLKQQLSQCWTVDGGWFSGQRPAAVLSSQVPQEDQKTFEFVGSPSDTDGRRCWTILSHVT